jgi:hypothetical protein
LEDYSLMHRLAQGGQETVKNYCHKREAKETLEFFKKIAR